MTDNLILITGCARSGTSMTAGVIHKCGVWGGVMFGSAVYNSKRAMFENADIREGLVKPMLRSIDADPMGQNPLPDMSKVSTIDSRIWKQKVLKSMERQGYKNGIWFYKGAKMCLVWPLWHKAFPDAKWVLVRRRDEDIINSCIRTGFMRAYEGRQGWQKWVLEHIKRFTEMKEAGLDIMEVYPQRMIDGNFVEIRSVIKWLGLTWREREVREFITPELWQGRKE